MGTSRIKQVEILQPAKLFTNKDLCGDCKFSGSFLCDKKFVNGIVETYYKRYGIKVYVFKINSDNKRKIIDLLHDIELEHHRKGCYFAIKATNFHCGEVCDCECDKTRCWNFEKIPSRRQPRCINFFKLKIPKEYKDFNFGFLLSNLESEK